MVVLEMIGKREGKDFFISRTGADKACLLQTLSSPAHNCRVRKVRPRRYARAYLVESRVIRPARTSGLFRATEGTGAPLLLRDEGFPGAGRGRPPLP